jgi:hypothetical protein
MKVKLIIAAAVAAVSIAGAGSAMAATYDLSVGTPTLLAGDDATVTQKTPISPTEQEFSYTYSFDLGATGPVDNATASIISISAVGSYHGKPSTTALAVTFHDLTTNTYVSLSGPALYSATGASVTLADNNDYTVNITGNNTTPKYNGAFQFDLATSVAPVPGPNGFLVAIAGMGGLLLMRRRASRGFAA